jgi:release factor glutamine methyltransferase
MPRIAEAYQEALQIAKTYDLLSADIRLLIAHDEGLAEQIDVIYHKDDEMKNYPLFLEQLELLKKGEPVEYIINEAHFLGRTLYVDNRVLIPRGETEELVAKLSEKISQYFEPRNYLVCADIGTGSGAITIALKDAFPHWLMLSSDISQDALDVAKKNFIATNTKTQLVLGDALAPFIEGKTNIDILVSNPPYIIDKEAAQDSVRNYEPSSALWMDKKSSVYESIFRDIYKVKKGSMYLAFEISPDLVSFLDELMKKYLHDYESEFVEDLNGLTRFLFVYLQ